LVFENDQKTWSDLQLEIKDLLAVNPIQQAISTEPLHKPKFVNAHATDTLAKLGLKNGDLLFLGGEPRPDEDSEYDGLKVAFINTELGGWLNKIEKVTPAGGYSVGNKISLADVVAFYILYDYLGHREDLNKVLTPHIKAVIDNVAAVLKDYLSSRPVTAF